MIAFEDGHIPKVAIITRTKDRPLMLQRCIRSVLGQIYQDWLHVIINDGGDPTTVHSVTSLYSGSYRGRLKILHNENSMGMQNASNRGIKETNSEYVVIHDDDDSWTPSFLSECIRYLDAEGPESSVQGVATQVVWIFEEMDKSGNIVEINRQDYFPFKEIDLFRTAGNNPFPPIAFLYRRKVHETIGYFNQEFDAVGDWDFNLRFLEKFDIGVIDKKLALYHWRHRSGGSAYGNTVTDGLERHKRLTTKMRNHYLRKDLQEGRLGLGFLMNFSETLQGHSAMMWDLTNRSDETLKKLDYQNHMSRYFEKITCDLFRLWKFKRFIERAGHYLAGKIHAMKGRHENDLSDIPEDWMTVVNRHLPQCHILSLDVFDTALLRKVKHPVDVFLFMEKEARLLLGNDKVQFVELRVNAERIARERAGQQQGYGDTALEEIYSVIQELTGVGDDSIKALTDLEIRAEEALLYGNPCVLALCRRAQREGKQVVFTSDMYLPRTVIERLLAMNGFVPHNLFVSSEFRVTKHSGELFDVVVEQCREDPAKILHLGDNEWSDVEQPRTKGLCSLHWKPSEKEVPFVDQIPHYSGAWSEDLISSVFTGLARKRRLFYPNDSTDVEGFWRSIGYEMIGPLYLSFVYWVTARATELGVQKLFFLARDGYHLIQVFHRLNERWKLPLEGHYLYSSRRLWNIPRIEVLDEAAVSFLTTPNPGMAVKHFLERIGLDFKHYERHILQCGFSSLDQVVTTHEGIFRSPVMHQNMRRLMKEIERDILKLAADERSVLFSYLEDVGLTSEKSAIVDVGWQASSVKSLQDLLSLNGYRSELHGFYFATWRFAQAAVDAGCRIESFFVHLDKPQYRAELLAECVELLECFFWAPYPSIVGLRKVNGCWEPVYGQGEIDDLQQRYLAAATESALEFVDEAIDLLGGPDTNSTPFAYLEAVLERILRHAKPKEAQILGELSLRNTFGGNGPLRYIAKLPPGRKALFDIEALQRAYDYCYWKKGFLAQLAPNQRDSLRI